MPQIKELENILELKYQRSQRSMAALVARETELRQKLVELDQNVFEMDVSTISQMRAIGADVAWKAWSEKARAKINIELAQVLAQKENVILRVKKDFTKLCIAQELSTTEQSNIKNARKATQLARVIDAKLASKSPSA